MVVRLSALYFNHLSRHTASPNGATTFVLIIKSLGFFANDFRACLSWRSRQLQLHCSLQFMSVQPRLFTTCVRRVQQNIVDILQLSKEHLFKVVHPFNRANLFYEVSLVSFPLPLASQLMMLIDTLH
jgi:hypothetical protein